MHWLITYYCNSFTWFCSTMIATRLILWAVYVKAYSQHMDWPELTGISRPSYTTHSLVTCVIVTTRAYTSYWLAAAKLQLVFCYAQFTPPARYDKTWCLCRVRRCELSLPDHPTSAFCVRVRPAVALRRRTQLHRPDTERTYLAVGPTQFTPPHRTRQNSPVCLVWRGGVN